MENMGNCLTKEKHVKLNNNKKKKFKKLHKQSKKLSTKTLEDIKLNSWLISC